MKKNPLRVFLCSLSLTLFASSFWPVYASPFSVSPVRIYMKPKDKAVAVTITNDGDKELVMQADLYSWKQKTDGKDELELTEDLLLTPPIIKLPGKSRQVVRLARLHRTKTDQQQTYRMVVREIPEALPSTGNLQLQIAIAFSLPVFITPPNAKYKLDCTASRSAVDTVSVTCENTGKAYAQLVELGLSSSSGQTFNGHISGGYILPTIKRSFDIKSENNKPIPSGTSKVNFRLDDGSTQSFDVTLTE